MTTAPAVSKSIPGRKYGRLAAGAVIVDFSGTDVVSGVSYCEPEKLSRGRDIEVAAIAATIPVFPAPSARFDIDLTSLRCA